MFILLHFQHLKEFCNSLLKPYFSPSNLNHLPEASKWRSSISELCSTVWLFFSIEQILFIKALIYTWCYDINKPYWMQLSGKYTRVFQIYHWLGNYIKSKHTNLFYCVDNFCSTSDVVQGYLLIAPLQLRGNYFPNIKNGDRFCFKWTWCLLTITIIPASGWNFIPFIEPKARVRLLYKTGQSSIFKFHECTFHSKMYCILLW